MATIDYRREPYVEMDTAALNEDPAYRARTGHFWLYPAGPFLIRENWPLRDYYVYFDWDPNSGVEFDHKPMRTDENGFPHVTDANGERTRRLKWLPYAVQRDKDDVQGHAIIYDKDPQKLEQKKKQIASMAKAHKKIPPEYHLKPLPVGKILVPTAKGFVEDLLELKEKCEAKLLAIKKATQAVEDFIQRNELNKIMFYERNQINAWLEKHPEKREKMGHAVRGKSGWDVSCETFDKVYLRLGQELKSAQEDLYHLLSDKTVRRKLALIDIVAERHEDGRHFLWRHQWLTEAWVELSSSTFADSVFKDHIKQVFMELGKPLRDSRSQCGCSTCKTYQSLREHSAAGDDSHGAGGAEGGRERAEKKLLEEEGWGAEQLMFGAETVHAWMNVIVHYRSQLARAIVATAEGGASSALKAGLFAEKYGERLAYLIGRAYSWENFKEFVDDLDRFVKGATNIAADAEESAAKLKAILGKCDGKLADKIYHGAILLGAAIAVYQFYKKDERELKDYEELVKAGFEVGYVGVERCLPKVLARKGLGHEAAHVATKRVANWVKVGGGAVSFAISIQDMGEAADTGSKHKFSWSLVIYAGDGLFFAGAVWDATVVGAPVGVAMNVIGGLIAIAGHIGEWLTEPDAEEKFLQRQNWLPP